MENKIVAVGDAAPDFTLKDQDGNEVTLSSMRGQKVVLSWHPLAWTSVCRTQMEQLEAHRADFEARNGVALGMSVDTVPSKKAWAEDMEIEHTRLLSDFWPHGGVAQAYRIFREQNGFSERAVFIVDEAGIVRFKKIYPIKELPDIGEIIAALSDV